MGQTIYLVRHGQDKDNLNGILSGHRDQLLTEMGEQQARQAALALKDKEIGIIYTSPLQRAFRTAEIIAEHIGVNQLQTDHELIERNFGMMTGQPIGNIKLLTNNYLEGDKVTYFLSALGAEDFDQLLSRAKSVVARVRSMHQGQNILLVTHGDMGKMIVAAFHGWTWRQGLEQPYWENGKVIELVTDDLVEEVVIDE